MAFSQPNARGNTNVNAICSYFTFLTLPNLLICRITE